MLEEILIISFAAFCTGAFSNFIDFCFEPGKILSWYFDWLVRKMCTLDTNGNIKSIDNHLFNPLGGCIVCYNWWLGVVPAIYVLNQLKPDAFGIFIVFFSFQSLSYYFCLIIKKQLS